MNKLEHLEKEIDDKSHKGKVTLETMKELVQAIKNRNDYVDSLRIYDTSNC